MLESHCSSSWISGEEKKLMVAENFGVYAVVNIYFWLNFSFPLFLCMLMYSKVHKKQRKTKITYNIYIFPA